MQKTYVLKKTEMGKSWKRDWYVIDAQGRTLGRLASQIARVLQGKHKAVYTPHVDAGDYVIVINAKKIKLTGDKPQAKMYRRYSGYPGGMKERSFQKVLIEKPELPLKEAVKNMLPKNTLGRRMLKKLKIYPDEKHPHEAQAPKALELSFRFP